MNESSRPVAFVALAVCGAALGATVYLGTTPGPSKAGPASSISGAPPAPPSSALAATTGFVPSPDLSAEEQVVLERLNEVRANPPAFLPHWRDYLASIPVKQCDEQPSMLDPIATYARAQPLAPNQALVDAARAHAKDMAKRDYFNHISPEGIGANHRAITAGYPLPTERRLTHDGQGYGSEKDSQQIESIYMTQGGPNEQWTGDRWRKSIDALVVDACVPSRGHRTHVLGASPLGARELEVGIGGGTTPSKLYIAIEIAMRNDSTRFVTGVVYRDKNSNKSYDVGEGIADTEVTLGSVSTKTAPGGGYVLPVPSNTKGTLHAAGASIPVTLVDQNVKLDVTVN